MKKIRFPFLTATLLLLASVFLLFTLGAVTAPHAIGLLILGQSVMLLADQPRVGHLFITGLSPSQVEDFTEALEGIKGYGGILKELGEKAKEHGGIGKYFERMEQLEKDYDELRNAVKRMKKTGMNVARSGVYTIGNKDFVTDECAKALTAHFLFLISDYEGGKHFREMLPDAAKRERLLSYSHECLGFNPAHKAALDGTTTPLPTLYMPQIVELVWKYGQARQYASVYPLGAGTVKLPRLKAGEDAFGFLGAGTAGMSQAVPEKRVTAELITFTANKAGGLIRIPSEIEEDTFIPLGQFLARYIARQLAKLEDTTLFLADGSGTYAGITGVGPYCAANVAYLQQLGAGKTKPTDATINDFRNMRGKVNAAVLVDDPAYYMHPSMESLLVTFNTIGSPQIYMPATPGNPPKLDGFPIRWTAVLQANLGVAAASAYLAMFGSLLYWYLGERGAPRVEVSRDVFFATDELAMRALERIDVEAMAIDAMSALQTAAQ